jgi:acyl dehydratase
MIREYFEDCCIGDRLVTMGRTITEADIVMFAAFSSDWNAMHTDTEYAKTTIFGERIAHGMLTLVVGTGLLFRLNESRLIPRSFIAIAGLDRIRFVAPVKIGDTLHLEGEVADMTKMSDQRGNISLKFSIKNQNKRSVVMGRLKFLAGCRSSGKKKSREVSSDG